MILFKYFRDLVYYSFEHEIDAYIKGYYEILRYFNRDNDRQKIKKYVKQLKFDQIPKSLKSFDYKKFIEDFKIVKDGDKFLPYLTNEFNKMYNGSEVSNIDEYYKNWQEHFHMAGVEYEDRLKSVIDNVINDFNKDENLYEAKYPEIVNKDDIIFDMVTKFVKLNF